MNKPFLALLALAAATVPGFVSAHPPFADPQFTCLAGGGEEGPYVPPVPVPRTMSYVSPLGASLSCDPAKFIGEFGSHTSTCPATVAVQQGVFCGPTLAPGQKGTCTLELLATSVRTGLVIALDKNANGGTAMGEVVFGPFPPSQVNGWTITNTGTAPARILGFPVNLDKEDLAANDVTRVICVPL